MGEKYVQEEFLGEESLDLYYISTITYEHKVNICDFYIFLLDKTFNIMHI